MASHLVRSFVSFVAFLSIAATASAIASETPARVPAEGLSAAGWTLMLGSIGAVLTLVAWCYRRVLASPRPQAACDVPRE